MASYSEGDFEKETEENRDEHLSSINANDLLLTELVSEGVMDEQTREDILAGSTAEESNKRLLTWFTRNPSSFDKFMKKLLLDKQRHVENLQNKDGAPDSSDQEQAVMVHVNNLNKYSDVLRRCTDINILTIAFLRSRDVIDDSVEAKLKAETVSLQRIDLIYSWLKQKSKDNFNEYINIMNENEQKHVANLLTDNLKGQQPMSLENYDRLKRILPIFIKGIYSRGPELASALIKYQASEDTDYAISYADYEDIMQGNKTDMSRNSILIDSVLRRTDFSFDSLKKALEDTHQEHMANYMIKGEVPRVHVNTTCPRREEDIARALNENIHMPSSTENNAVAKSLDVLNGYKLPIVAAEPDHSIMIYTYCETPDDMKRYIELLHNGRLRIIYQDILNEILKVIEPETEQTLEAALNLEEEDKQLIEDFIGLDDGEDLPDDEPSIIVDPRKVPFDIDDVAAQKLIESLEEEEAHPGKRARLSKRELSKLEKIRAILRNNSEYLMEHIHPNGTLISQLHTSGCLTDDQMRLVRSLRRNQDRNHEILNAIQETTYDAFIRCLWKNGQNLVANVMAKGGAVLKVRVAFMDKSIPSIEKQIVEKINLLQDKSQLPNEEVARMLSLLKIGSIEILNAKQEMGIIVWLWCQSDPAFHRIIEMNEEERLDELLLWLFNKLLNNETPQLAEIEVDIGDTEMEFVCNYGGCQSLLGFNLRATFKSSHLGMICGLTKLRESICVLCQKPSCVLVFSNLNFSSCRKTVHLNDLEPVDIAACNITGSLYISDSSSSSIWKVTEYDNKVCKWLENISNPFTLSVIRNGEVVIVRRDKTCLEIYGPDAKKLYDIKLPPGYVPNHAVETSSGNFIVTYGKKCEISSSIFEITREGKIVKTGSFRYEPFTGLSDATNDYLIPKEIMSQNVYLRYISLDRHDRVYAADFHNGGVLQFDSRLMLCPKLPMFAGVKQTLRLCLIENETLLMVVHGDPTRLNVYEI